MPSPYSYDLRCKAIDAVKHGERKVDVCRMLNISRTLHLYPLSKQFNTSDHKTAKYLMSKLKSSTDVN